MIHIQQLRTPSTLSRFRLYDFPARRGLLLVFFICINPFVLNTSALAADNSAPTYRQPVATLAENFENRKPRTPPAPGEALELGVKELGNFNYDEDRGGNIPDDVKKLSGCTVRLRGFMIPLDLRERITQFALVPSLASCCFGKPPQVHHKVVSTFPKGKSTKYFADEIVVEGTLHVEEMKDDGYIVSIFQLDVTSVKSAPRK